MEPYYDEPYADAHLDGLTELEEASSSRSRDSSTCSSSSSSSADIIYDNEVRSSLLQVQELEYYSSRGYSPFLLLNSRCVSPLSTQYVDVQSKENILWHSIGIGGPLSDCYQYALSTRFS